MAIIEQGKEKTVIVLAEEIFVNKEVKKETVVKCLECGEHYIVITDLVGNVALLDCSNGCIYTEDDFWESEEFEIASSNTVIKYSNKPIK